MLSLAPGVLFFFWRGNPTFSGELYSKLSYWMCQMLMIYMHCVGDLWYFGINFAVQTRGAPYGQVSWIFKIHQVTRKMGSFRQFLRLEKNTTRCNRQPLHMRPWFSGTSMSDHHCLVRLRIFMGLIIPCIACNHGAQDAVPNCVFLDTLALCGIHWHMCFVFCSNCD